MTINLMTPRQQMDFKPRISVIGVGGAGGNAVNNMIRANLEGVDFLVCNTDAQAMTQTVCERKLQLGADLTQGLGAGSKPDVGRAAAEESLNELMELLAGNHMVFVTAGMGGGTGTGAAPVIARACREQGMLTVGVVTKPFLFEGRQRMKLADAGIDELQQHVDTLIVIPNQNLFRVANEKTTFADAFRMADDVLYAGVRSVTDLMVVPGMINLDFADVRSVIGEMGKAKMGTGEAEGDRRAIEAAEGAINNPLLEDLSMKSARGLLINITGSESTMTLMEVDEAVNRILEEVDAETDMIFGSTFDESLDDKIRISVVATGIDVGEMNQTRPAVISRPQPRPAAVPEPDVAPVKAEVAMAEADVAVEPRHATPEPAMAEVAEAQVAETAGSAADMVALMEMPVEGAPAPAAPEPVLAAEDSYIPPPPVYPEEPGHAEPFAAAALANGADPEPAPKRRRPGLLELMAEVAGVASGERRAERKPRERVEPKASPVAAKGEARPAAPSVTSQPALGDMEPAPRPGPTEAEGEMLDIPAFLRRQAN
ncbi:MAG: cell division protein FtsZ [Alphaproteobacteria bacterium]|nr:cell division protein FtsZ [Alphaproteobacteria bacterium]